jgi:pyruvate dehydrogenase E1 component beta subunit
VVEIMTINFSILSLDQIVNHGAKIYGMFGGQTPVPMVLRTPGGGGQQLAATHSQNLEVWYAFVPGLKVVTPATPADAKGMLRTAIRDDDPVIFIENLALYNTKGEVPDGDYTIEFGKATVTKPGTDITIVAYSRMAVVALDVANRLEAEGISAEVVDVRSLRPLDRETIAESVRKTGRAVVMEEDWLSYGVGAELAATIQEGAFDYLDAPVRRVAMSEVPLPYAKPLELAALPNATHLIEVIHETMAASGAAKGVR